VKSVQPMVVSVRPEQTNRHTTGRFHPTLFRSDFPIFSLVHKAPTKYLFPAGKTIAHCRKRRNKVLGNRYCDFIIVAKEMTYNEHRQYVLT
jgi:hypothetical protein